VHSAADACATLHLRPSLASASKVLNCRPTVAWPTPSFRSPPGWGDRAGVSQKADLGKVRQQVTQDLKSF